MGNRTLRVLLIALPSALMFPAFAQDILPFPPPGGHLLWKYSYTGSMILNAFHQYAYDGEDVELDGQVYKSIRRSHYYEVHNGPGSVFISESHHEEYCHLRTDQAGVSYIHSTEFPPEEVLFDPSIEVGDTMPATWRLVRRDWYDEVVTVTAIDSMVDNLGTQRRVWHFNTPGVPWPLTFSEGIGCTQEFLGIPHSQGGPISQLLCATYDAVPVFGGTCNPLAVFDTPASNRNAPLRVIHRPGTTTYDLSRICSGTIHDATGRALSRFGPGKELHLSGEGAGMYILRADDGSTVRFFHQNTAR